MKRLNASCAVFFALIAFFFFILIPISAQTTKVVGAYSGNDNKANTYPTPYGDFRETMRAQYLYKVDELILAGVQPGLITAIGFIVTTTNGMDAVENLKIRVSGTLLDSLPSTLWAPAAGQIFFDTASYTPIDGGNLHTLDIPFIWDGSSNLLIDVCHTPTDPGLGNFATFNASVQLSDGLGFKASRTFAEDDYPMVCGTSEPIESGSPFSRPVLLVRQSCLPPSNLQVLGVYSQMAIFSATAPISSQGYIWEIGPAGFTPGTGTAFVRDTTILPIDTFFNLANLQNFEIYVSTNCGGGLSSSWIGPVAFTTPPGCNDIFYDNGGDSGDYPNNSVLSYTICADNASDVVKLAFLSVNLGVGDVIKVYNGTDTGFPLLGTLQIGSAPTVFTGTTFSGCVTMIFESDTAGVAPGFTARVSCGVPDSCFDVVQVEIQDIKPTKATFGWIKPFDISLMRWELRLQSNNGLVFSGVTASNTVTINGLVQATQYKFLYKSLCVSGDSTPWKIINFFTPLDCANAPVITCGQFGLGVFSTGPGIYNLSDCGGATVGQENLFKFTAPNTRMYNLEIFSTTNSNIYVSYFIKEVSGAVCNDQDWVCFAHMNTVESESFGPLIAGRTYYILADVESTAIFTQTFRITGCGPTNDEAWQAQPITLGSDCASNTYANTGATLHAGIPSEPNPDTNPLDGYPGRWLTTADATVWFSFVAPPSGTVLITADSLVGGNLNQDSQLALYEASDPNNYGTFNLLVSDDDNGTSGLGYSSIMTYSGLNPGQTYYLQVDEFSTFQGPFCIRIEEGTIRVADDDCTLTYSEAPVNGTTPGGDRWYGIYTRPNILDLGELVAAVKPGPQNLDTVFVRVDISDTIPNTTNLAYMPAYFHFNWSNTAATGPVQVRLFYKDSEFAGLKQKANQALATIDDLVCTYYDGPNEDCFFGNNNYVSGTASLLSNVQSAGLGTSGMFYLELSIPGPGEVSAHLGAIALPLELISFRGKAEPEFNHLEWTTTDEYRVQWHVLERSNDGISWREIGRTDGKNTPGAHTYEWIDRYPPTRAYYRLHSVDFDGTAAVSPAIFIERPPAFGIMAVYPSPVSEQLTLEYQVTEESDVLLLISTLDGRLVEQRNIGAVKGANRFQLPTAEWTPGMYLLQIRTDSQASEVFKVLKK